MQSEQEDRITIKQWSAVGIWKWAIKEDRCAIDKQTLFGSCLQCESEGKIDDCKIQAGSCNHAFHLHCIERWISNNNTCPLCNKQWTDTRIL
ncbi:RING-box protein 1 [Paramecium bursaria]